MIQTLILLSFLSTNISLYKVTRQITEKILKQEKTQKISYNSVRKSELPSTNVLALLKKIKEFKNQKLLKKADIIIGDTPGETLRITGSYQVDGNIILINDGVLIVKNASLTLKGSILGNNNSEVLIDSSYIHFPQIHIYQYGIFLYDSSYFEMKNTEIFGNFMPLNFGLTGNVIVNMTGNNFDNAFFTTVLFGASELTLNKGNLPGEYIMMDSSKAHFKNIDSLLLWLHLVDQSSVDFQFPRGFLTGFVFDSTLPNVSGIKYHVDIDSSSGVMWGLFPSSGCDAVIRNSEIRTIGIFLEHTNNDTLRNLINESFYTSYKLTLTDRNFTLDSTYVHTWSIYPWDTSFTVLNYSIVGEVLSMGNSFIISHNFFLDGSGGHLEATDNSVNIVYLANLTCDVITHLNGIQIIAYSSQLYGSMWVRDNSNLVLLQSEYSSPPVLYDSAYLIVGKIDRLTEYNTDDTLYIIGDAFADRGPLNPSNFDLEHYTLHYMYVNDTIWNFIGYYNTEKRNDTLGKWVTQGLTEGTYFLKMILYTIRGDTFELTKQVNLYPVKINEKAEIKLKKDIQRGVYDITGRKLEFSRNFRKGVYFIKKGNNKTLKVIKFK